MRTHYAIATAVGAFLLGCAAAFTFITMRGPRSYDECMLDEMRGQATIQGPSRILRSHAFLGAVVTWFGRHVP
jgi:hypothetical protein